MPQPKIPNTYTFGNHMHWVDMQWLWGYHVLPGSARDMLHYCRETGAKGNLNFDGVGLEKMAAEAPDALAELKKAVEDGTIEPVGCSYGQPYGLFHGGESNIRQRIYGVRTVRRLLGVWSKTFWEEEFDFFPQLPQILRGVGMEFASLYFQWTWHTPEVPRETDPVVWWEGVDGSKLKCATRNALNLHQWPEDFQILLDDLASGTVNVRGENPLILQWLELMPSPDWMCRSELMIPKLLELKRDERFEVIFATLGGYLQAASDDLPVRRYGMGDVWHGMSLGKNGDNMRRLSAEAERYVLAAEVLSSVNSLFGRPYAQWDVYPAWELEEAWRELLQAQHHDNDECEGLCGHVGRFSYERSKELSARVVRSNTRVLVQSLGFKWQQNYFELLEFHTAHDSKTDGVRRVQPTEQFPSWLVFNSLGWERTFKAGPKDSFHEFKVPAFGTTIIDWNQLCLSPPKGQFDLDFDELTETEKSRINDRPTIESLSTHEFPEGMFSAPIQVSAVQNGNRIELGLWLNTQGEDYPDRTLRSNCGGIVINIFGATDRPDPGLNASIQAEFHFSFEFDLIADYPLGVEPIVPIEKGLKKYPSGEWMTSSQWFEEVKRPFTALSFVDFVDRNNPDRGVLVAHDGSQQWMLGDEPNSAKCVINAYDPWDEDYFQRLVRAQFLIVPHGPITNAERWKIAQDFRNPVLRLSGNGGNPGTFAPFEFDCQNAVMTALYREESGHAGQHIENYAGNGIEHPFIVRFLELNGEPASSILKVKGHVEKAFRTNLLGQIESELAVTLESGHSLIPIELGPREIATIYLDIVEGRKQPRNLDEHREVWATVHRVDQ